MIDLEQLRDFMDKAQRIQSILDELNVGPRSNGSFKTADDVSREYRATKRKKGRPRKATAGASRQQPPMFTRAKVLYALSQGQNTNRGITEYITNKPAEQDGVRRVSVVLAALKKNGLARRRGKNKWSLTPAGTESANR